MLKNAEACRHNCPTHQRLAKRCDSREKLARECIAHLLFDYDNALSIVMIQG